MYRELEQAPAITGWFPAEMYRAFTHEAFARDFVSYGRFRMAKVQYYKKVEDQARRDGDEGIGSLLAPSTIVQVQLDNNGTVKGAREVAGDENITSCITNAVYLLCCSLPDASGGVDHLAKFGEHVIRINDPKRFCQDLTDYLWKGPPELGCMAQCEMVRYDKFQKTHSWPNKREMIDLAYRQKAETFSDEREVRVVAIPGQFDEDAENFLTVDLGGPLPYIDWIK